MIRFFENYDLSSYNTFGIKAHCRYFFEFTEPVDLITFVTSNTAFSNLPLLVLGGGSNILFTKDFDGLVIHANIPGIKVVKEDRCNIWIEAGAGEIWDDFVEYCVNNGLGGVENLSLIPGVVGATPVQNIGAYGQEAGNVIELVRTYNLETKREEEYSSESCEFSYRDSVFKRNLKNKIVVTSVIYKLNKFPEFNIDYGRVAQEIKRLGGVTLQNIRKAIVSIRTSKLPDVSQLGNAGSFFKNPVITNNMVENLKKKHPDIPVYPLSDGRSKIAAGWLIERAGWKGYKRGNVGVHSTQALVLVNFGNATGNEIFNLSEDIKNSVLEKFNISLEREVNCF